MRKADSLWRALERSAVSAVRSEWQEVLGPDFPAAEPYLRPTGELATALACPRGGDPHHVWHHDDGTIVETCVDDQCDTVEITRDVLVAYRFCFQSLGAQLGAILGLSGTPGPADGLVRAWTLGELVPRAGERFPAFLACPQNPKDFGALVERLLGRTRAPFILLVPRAERCPPPAADLLRQRGAELMALAEHLMIDENGRLTCGDSASDVLAGFRARVAPRRTAGALTFETPPRARWEDVRVHFENAHEITVTVLGVRERFDYRKVGLADGRTEGPNKQWMLLRAFAYGDGALERPVAKGGRAPDKQRDRLGSWLQSFLAIDGDPIETDSETWRLRLKVSTER